jgi:hypothetical protein
MSIFPLLGIFRPYKAKIWDVSFLVHLPKVMQFFSNSQKWKSQMFLFFSFEIPFGHFSFNFSFIFIYFDWKSVNHHLKFKSQCEVLSRKFFPCCGIFRCWPKNPYGSTQHCSDTSHTYILLSWRPVVLSVFSFFSPVFLQLLEVASALLKWAI